MVDKPEMLKRYLSQAHDIVLACDPDGRITFANRAAARAFGVPSKRLIGRELLEGVEEFSQSLAADLFEQSLQAEGWHGEILLRRGDGEVFPAYVSASPICSKSGDVERVLVVAHDITLRKQFEEEIRKRAGLAGSIIRSAPIGIFTLDTSRRFQAANQAFTEMVDGPKPTALLDQPFDSVASEVNPDLIRAIDAALEGEETFEHNRPLKQGDEGDLTVSLIAMPLRDPDGNVEGVLVIVENRTELVRVEEQLLQADRLASTGFLAAGIAHEIRNPLTGISTIIDNLANRVRREGGDQEPYERVLANIHRIEDIIRRLLDFANPAEIQAQESDINQLVMQVLDFFKFHPLFRKIAVEWDLADDIPEIVVDPKQIQLIFHNLAMNAAQAMEESGGRLEISSRCVAPGGDDRHAWIEVRLRDTGPGIPDHNLRRIFDPFFTTKPPGEGTGLGLSVSYSIAKNHGGELRARNRPEGGAEFVLRLPVGTA